MITLTATASERIKQVLESKGKPEACLRVYVAPGGCSGYSYGMAIEDAPSEGDAVLEQHGLKVLVDPTSAGFLEGAEIDYVEDFMGGGFTFHNPNAVSSCGCGSSFRTAEKGGQPKSCC